MMDFYDAARKTVIWLNEEYRSTVSKYMTNKSNVILGRKFSLGTEFQYEFAKRLFEGSSYLVLVDTPIKLPNRKQRVYPDIVIIKDNELRGLMEVKMDCGWIGEDKLKDELETYKEITNSSSFSYSTYTDESMEKKKPFPEVVIPKNIKKIFVIVSRKNDHDRIDEYVRELVETAGFELLILLENTHPNGRVNSTEIEEDIAKRKDEIRKIINF